MTYNPTQAEQEIDNAIRDIYNSGQCAEAVAMAVDFFARFPNSPLARYNYAVMHGDFSYSPEHDQNESARLREIAKQGISELFNDPDFAGWPSRFQQRIRNEFYWFFERPQAQYPLGLELLIEGTNGHHPACVGSAMLAYKALVNAHVSDAEKWATISIKHFLEFEKAAPDWYNINHFAAQALACLGQYERALTCFRDTYGKQKGPEKPDEIAAFMAKFEEIRTIRGDL